MGETEHDPDREAFGPAYSDAERDMADALFTAHYETLKNIARVKRRRSDPQMTLSTSDVLHETFLKLGDGHWNDDSHFLSSASLAMRHVICDYARKRYSAKRNKKQERAMEDSERLLPEFRETPEEILVISDLVERLGAEHPRLVKVLDMRYFAGMTEQETADALGLSVRTVRRDWQEVREWLKARMAG